MAAIKNWKLHIYKKDSILFMYVDNLIKNDLIRKYDQQRSNSHNTRFQCWWDERNKRLIGSQHRQYQKQNCAHPTTSYQSNHCWCQDTIQHNTNKYSINEFKDLDIQLLISHQKTQLSSFFPTQYIIHSAPMCTILIQPKEIILERLWYFLFNVWRGPKMKSWYCVPTRTQELKRLPLPIEAVKITLSYGK